MNDTKNTAGPWSALWDAAPDIVDEDGKAVASVWDHGDAERQVADARLIAAAPDLLAALVELVDALDAIRHRRFLPPVLQKRAGFIPDRRSHDAYVAGRDVIAKATGGQS